MTVLQQGYAGEVTDRGFALRRFGSAARGDSRPAIDVRGVIRPEQDQTRVAVVMRHGRLLVAFTWLLVAVASLAATAGNGARRSEDVSPAAGAAVLVAMGAMWHVFLWWDMGRVRREIIKLLAEGASDGPANNVV
jgi:hypothetical protein